MASVVGAVLLAGVLSGCRVDTRVSVVEKGGGAGSFAVTVTLDKSALDALGGETALAKQLQYGDLESAGWTISGPNPVAGGGASLSATHGFSSGAELSRLMSDVAGSGPAGSAHPFRLTVSSGGGFFTDKTTVRGAVDLRCGLDCFADPGLQSKLGGPLGVTPQPLEQAAGQTAAQVFGFSLALRMPGHPRSAAGAPAVSRDGTLTWSAPLGRSTVVGAVSESVDWGHVILVAVLAGLVLLGGGFGWWRWRRRRRRRGLPGETERDLPGEPVASVPGEGR